MSYTRPDLDRLLHAPLLRHRPDEVTEVETWLADHLALLGGALGLRLSAAPDVVSQSDHLHRLVARNDDDGAIVYIVACLDHFDDDVIIETLTDPIARKARILIWIAESFVADSLADVRELNGDGDEDDDRHFAVACRRLGATSPNSEPRFDVMVSA